MNTTALPSIWCLAGSIALSVLSACSGGAPPKPPPPPSPVQDASRPVIVVSASQSGAEVTVQRPQALQIELASDARAVSSGYEWQLVDTDPALLAAEAARFERAPRDVNDLESAGTTIWRFRPLASGHVDLRFALRRPRRLDPPIETVHYGVTVR